MSVPPEPPIAPDLAELTRLRIENDLFRAVAAPNPITKIDTEYELLSGEIRRGLADGVKVGGAVLVLLGAATAALPQMHLPAADLTVLTALSAGVSAFLSWATRHGITAQSGGARGFSSRDR